MTRLSLSVFRQAFGADLRKEIGENPLMIRKRLPGLKLLHSYLELVAGARTFEDCVAFAVSLFQKYFK